MANLKLFGLNSYEAKAYEALLEGASTAHALAKKSGVPSGKIYPTLESLETKGFILFTAGRPKMYVALSPEVVFDKVLREKESYLKVLKQNAKTLINQYAKISPIKDHKPQDLVETYFGHTTAFTKSISLHDESKEYWKTISRLTINKDHLDACSRAIKRGVKVFALTSMKETTPERVAEWKKRGVKIQFLDELPFRLSVYDDKGVVFRFSHEKSKKYVSTHIQNKRLAKGMNHFFDSLWVAAKKNRRFLK